MYGNKWPECLVWTSGSTPKGPPQKAAATLELDQFAAVAAHVFEEEKQIGDAEEFADLWGGIDHLNLAAARAGGNVECGDGAEAGAVHLWDSFQIQ